MSNKVKLGLSTIFLGSVLLLFSSCEQAVTYPDENISGVYRTLTIDSKPSGATIFINGKNMGQKTPDSLVWLASDTNAITLRLADFRDTIFTAMAPQGVNTTMMVDFTQNPRMRGSIYFDSYPDSADIYFGDSAIGLKTPSRIKNLLPGEYIVRYKHYNCVDAVSKIKVVSDKTTTNSVALEDTTLWVSYRPDNSGLPELFFNSVYIDPHDVKWFGGSTTGLTRYDEQTWKNFSTSNSNIPSDNVNCITEDLLGNLWIGTNRGLAKFNNNSFSVYDNTNSGLTSNNITALRPGVGDSLWIGTANGVFLYSGNTWQKFDPVFLGNSYVNSLAISRTGLLYVCTVDGLFAYSGSTKYDFSGMVSTEVSAFIIEYSGKGWIGTIGHGQDGGMFYKTKYSIDNVSGIANPPGGGSPYVIFSKFTGKDIYDIFLTPENTLWVSTSNGLGKCTVSTANTPVFLTTSNGSLRSNVIKAVRRDSNKYCWIVTSGGGVNKYKGN